VRGTAIVESPSNECDWNFSVTDDATPGERRRVTAAVRRPQYPTIMLRISFIIRPHRMHRVQRWCLLLQMWCEYVCLSVLGLQPCVGHNCDLTKRRSRSRCRCAFLFYTDCTFAITFCDEINLRIWIVDSESEPYIRWRPGFYQGNLRHTFRGERGVPARPSKWIGLGL